MRFCSVFSGVEAASLAFLPLGWQAVCFSEIEEFPSAVLKHRYPEVPNLGDITKINWKEAKREFGAVDLVVGGSPCQSFSIAGTRTGLDGESGLMWEYVRCVCELMPRWLLWENVPGALSSSHGEDFRCLLESLDALGYGLAWRVLDAQFFGVPQRRERVYLVGRLGDPSRAVEVLFEPESLRWDPPSSREKREALTRGARRGSPCAGFKYSAGSKAGNIGYEEELSPTVTADYHCPATLVSEDHKASTTVGVSGTLPPSTGGFKPGAVVCMTDSPPQKNNQTPFEPKAFAANQRGEVRLIGGNGTLTGVIPATQSGKQVQGVCQGYAVRRLTPRECERLQGMPDDWTRVPYRGKAADECPDTPRYKAIGNSMAVPVMRWIGQGIDAADRSEQED